MIVIVVMVVVMLLLPGEQLTRGIYIAKILASSYSLHFCFDVVAGGIGVGLL